MVIYIVSLLITSCLHFTLAALGREASLPALPLCTRACRHLKFSLPILLHERLELCGVVDADKCAELAIRRRGELGERRSIHRIAEAANKQHPGLQPLVVRVGEKHRIAAALLWCVLMHTTVTVTVTVIVTAIVTVIVTATATATEKCNGTAEVFLCVRPSVETWWVGGRGGGGD